MQIEYRCNNHFNLRIALGEIEQFNTIYIIYYLILVTLFYNMTYGVKVYTRFECMSLHHIYHQSGNIPPTTCSEQSIPHLLSRSLFPIWKPQFCSQKSKNVLSIIQVTFFKSITVNFSLGSMHVQCKFMLMIILSKYILYLYGNVNILNCSKVITHLKTDHSSSFKGFVAFWIYFYGNSKVVPGFLEFFLGLK